MGIFYSLYIFEMPKRCGDDHPDTFATMHELGVLYTTLARYDEAEPLFTEAISDGRSKLGMDTKEVLARSEGGQEAGPLPQYSSQAPGGASAARLGYRLRWFCLDRFWSYSSGSSLPGWAQ